VRFWAAILFLNAVLSVRFPERVSWLSYLVPSLDVVALLVALALLGAWHKQIPGLARGVLVGFFLICRVLRVADGVEQGAYLRDFNWSVDLPLLPEFVRLFYATLPLPVFMLAGGALLLSLGALCFLVARALRVLETELSLPAQPHTRVLSLLIGMLAVASLLFPPRAVFGDSILTRMAAEARFAARLPSYRTAEQARIAGVQQQLATHPNDLLKLQARNVYLFVIESYGQAVLDRPELFARVLPEYRRFEADLAHSGFQIASRVLESPTYGGRSWLAQATLLTSLPTQDPLQFELLRAAQPSTLAQVFRAAGYRSVLVQPGTVRESTAPELYHFEQHYFARELGYAGPRFGWATMPDQFVLDAVRRKELTGTGTPPLFVCYALVSSHIPWSDLPPLVQDWSTIGDGSGYQTLPQRHFATSWLSLSSATGAYAESVVYDLDVLRRYIVEFVHDDSLLIVLGDHQPHSEITGQSPLRGVPVHVLSRNGAFIAPFRSRGYTAGMVADEALPRAGLDSLMLDLLADFSIARSGSAR
jgi:hypothetical protein